jgi:CheY-like chemotaxis protein
MGFNVVESSCGDEAIVQFRDRGPFDLVLTDLYYFDDITEPPLSKSDCIRDGVQFAQSVRTIRPDQQIAIHTASPLQLVGELAGIPVLEKGANEFLPKLKKLLSAL